MAKGLQRKKIEKVRNKVSKRLETIAKLQKEIPSLKKAEEELDWMLRAEENAPPIVNIHLSENLLQRLNTFDIYLTKYSIPKPSYDSDAFINSSGTASSSDYINNVYQIRDSFTNDEGVLSWAIKVSDSYFDLRVKQARTEMVSSRLGQLNNRLMNLHKSAIDACLSTSAGSTSPVEGAALLRELLDSFKGELIRRCKKGKGATYQRIADNLAFDKLRSMISDQQEEYDNLHSELSGILKSRTVIQPSRIRELLTLTEDHISVVILVLDPEKIGFEFYTS